MDKTNFGSVQMTEEDRSYQGSRFSEVRDAIFANPYQKVWGGKDEPSFPVYQVTLASILQGILPFGRPHLFRHAVERSVDSHADLRWGEEGRGVRRLLHPNGVCLTVFGKSPKIPTTRVILLKVVRACSSVVILLVAARPGAVISDRWHW